MKKAICATVVLGLASCAFAHMGEGIVPIVELSDADLALIDVTDGNVADWQDIVGEATLTSRDFVAFGEPDPASFDFRIWLGWHDASNRLYAAMEQIDDIYCNHFDREDFSTPNFFLTLHDGSLRLYVDGDHDGGRHAYPNADFDTDEEWALAFDQGAQGYAALGEVFDDGPHISTIVTELLSQPASFTASYEDWFIQPPYAEGGGAARGESPSIAVTEFYVTPFDRLIWNSPEESRISDLFPGKTIGANIALGDRDDGNRSSSYSLAPFANETAGSADGFADLLLLGADGTAPEVTAVVDMSWGRIKAALRAE